MKTILQISGLDCAGCAAKLESQLNKIDGVAVKINFFLQKMTVETSESNFDNALASIVKTAKRCEPQCIIRTGKKQ